jgi:uncharacterized protein (DUF433 family)/tRNA A-37 threonylcarbamoyl transferase component Bud32
MSLLMPDWRSRLGPGPGTAKVRSAGIAVAEVLRLLAMGHDAEEVLRQHPGLSRDDIHACLAYAAETVAKTALPPSLSDEATLPPPSTEDTPTLAPLSAGTVSHPPQRIRVPGYEILDELGRGGMGVVYRARQLKLNRMVALKMILAGEHASAEMLARFQNEAEAVARLQHPGIVQIFEIGEHEGHAFLALEFVAGGSLAARLSDKPWAPDKAVVLVEKIARAIHEAHQQGIVHRDLKPENVLLSPSSPSDPASQLQPKITDFGLAKRLETTGQTQTGAVMGTASYMAPEQAAGKKDIGPAADTYALGGILYRLLAGRPPFEGATSLDVLVRVLDEEPSSLRQLNPAVPRDVDIIALKCLRKEPDRRYRSAAEVADDLRRYLDGEPIRARQVSVQERLWRWVARHPGPALLRGSVGLLLLAIVGFSAFSGMTGPGGIGLFCLLLVVAMRSRPRTMLFAGLLAIPFVLGVILLASTSNLTSRMRVWILPATTIDDLAVGLGMAPLLVALLAGAFFRERWHALLIGGGVFLLLVWIGYPGSIAVVLASSVGVSFLAFLCRFVRHRLGGNLLDVTCGAILGNFVGIFLGALLGGCFGMWSATRILAGQGGGGFLWLYFGTMILGAIAGSIIGAVLTALATRPRRPTG